MVSIITPVYNTENYLQQFIQSVLAQSYEDFELLLIDDGSTDNSMEICNKFASLDGRIKVFHQNREGVANARNLGLSNAIGSYVMFADSDDYLTSNALELTVGLITRTNADIVQANWYRDKDGVISYSKRLMETRSYDNRKAIRAFLNSRLLGGYIWAKLYRAEILKKIEFPGDMSLGEDGVFAFRAFLNASKIVYTATPIYYYRIRQDSLSMRGNANFSDRDLDVFKQIEYVTACTDVQKYNRDILIFTFSLYRGAIDKYLSSDDESRSRFVCEYNEMNDFCRNNWKGVVLYSTNPRIKLIALKYAFKA